MCCNTWDIQERKALVVWQICFRFLEELKKNSSVDDNPTDGWMYRCGRLDVEVCASAMRFLESLRGLVRGRFGTRLLYRAGRYYACIVRWRESWCLWITWSDRLFRRSSRISTMNRPYKVFVESTQRALTKLLHKARVSTHCSARVFI